MTAPTAQSISTEFFSTVLSRSNPFNDQRVSATGTQAVDVASIHDREFRTLVDLAARACSQNEAVGAVVWGESGSGKSNLLRRLHDWSVREDTAIVVNFLELQASPDRLLRSVLNAVLSTLTRGLSPPWHRTLLYQLLQGLIRPAVYGERKLLPLKELKRVYRTQIAGLIGAAGETAATRAAIVLLERFLIAALAEKAKRPEAAAAVVALRRLSGDSLDEEEAKLLGLRASDVASPFDSSDSVRVLALLTQVAQASGKPVIICFDQIHTLTRQQVIDIACLIHTLNDHVRNTLLVLSEVQAELRGLYDIKTFSQATWDRMTANQIEMPRLTVAQGRQILVARLHEFHKTHRSNSEVIKLIEADTLFPLGQSWFEQRSADLVDLRPRHMLRIARLRWDELQFAIASAPNAREAVAHWSSTPDVNPPAPPKSRIPRLSIEDSIDAVVEKAFATKSVRHLAAPHGLPPNADNLCTLTESLLSSSGAGMVVAKGGSGSPYDLFVHVPNAAGAEVTFGIAFVATGSANSVTSTLGNLANDTQPPHRVLLVTDQRLPLAFGKAAKALGRNHYKTLKAMPNFEHLELRFKDYADLETLESTSRMAADLEIDMPDGKSRPLTRDEILAAYRRAKRFHQHPLLGKFFRH